MHNGGAVRRKQQHIPNIGCRYRNRGRKPVQMGQHLRLHTSQNRALRLIDARQRRRFLARDGLPNPDQQSVTVAPRALDSSGGMKRGSAPAQRLGYNRGAHNG